ncbi:Ig-like domain-containing protein [uncultured Piscinibacter sp.]|uniref:Ig-like domain-containing protein n=1 Tax=uncultured Piscinibacter sp. TaxID=1131835 RepID=UPI00260D0145|nr:Ig-like domain-containing protein [uncultured Piscinibacter sp.]
MKLAKAIWILLCAFALASCGGSGDAGDSPFTPGDGTGTVQVGDVVLTLSSALLANTGSETSSVTVTVLDGSRNVIAAVPVTITADSDAVLQVSAAETDDTGNITATLSIGANRANRVITVTASAGGVTRTANVQVFGAKIQATVSPALLDPSEAGVVRYTAVDNAGNPMPGQQVQITAAGMDPASASGVTDASGEFVFNYTAPATPGDYTISATVAGATDVQTIQVQIAGVVPVVTTTIDSGSVRVSPSVVAVNLPGSQSNRAEVRALFVGPDNQPIKNVRVRFDLAGDPLNVGGSFTVGSAPDILYSNADGVVTTFYVPGTRSSPTDGVTIRACYGVSESDPNLLNCTTFATQTLTVSSDPLSVTIGTNGLVTVGDLTYTKRFNIVVVDAAGNVVPDVSLVASVDLPSYRKGGYTLAGAWVQSLQAICPNEDLNRNGVLEAGEDANGDGILWPRKADVSIRLLSQKTDAAGSAILEVTYNQDHGTWVDALITVAASGIAGTEGRASYLLSPVPVDAASAANTSASPAYRLSPYGVSNDCASPN